MMPFLRCKMTEKSFVAVARCGCGCGRCCGFKNQYFSCCGYRCGLKSASYLKYRPQPQPQPHQKPQPHSGVCVRHVLGARNRNATLFTSCPVVELIGNFSILWVIIMDLTVAEQFYLLKKKRKKKNSFFTKNRQLGSVRKFQTIWKSMKF